MTTQSPGGAELLVQIPAARARAAYEETRAERDALQTNQLRPQSFNIDITSATIAILGRMPRMLTLRAAIVSQLPQFNIQYVDKLDTYALAMSFAHAEYLTAPLASSPVEAVAQRLRGIRDIFVADITTLEKRGMLNGRLTELTGGPGYKPLTRDMQMLVGVLRDSWPTIQNRTAVTLEEIDEAERLNEHLMATIGRNEQLGATPIEEADARLRSFTLFIIAYEACERAINYLRFDEKDTDSFLPPIRTGGRSKSKAEKETAAPVQPAPAPPVSPVAAPVPAAPVAAGTDDDDPFNR